LPNFVPSALVTSLVHGPDECRQVVAASQALFGRGPLQDLNPGTLRSALVEAGLTEVRGALPSVISLLRETGLATSLSDARRTVAEGGAYLNNARVTDGDADVPSSALLHGRWLVLRRGRRSLAGVELVP
jgi:tyrosyl-tRNA synthetase